ncbi:hypothetical protein GF412_04075 [Candidatus Micrarchaeota archaeon]|nr:hypothetical protein [Candidatus Micrarchaeota archaeon]MBD3418127.1 hypothetical protein [Candidatus Micrarchaeota archaeon]
MPPKKQQHLHQLKLEKIPDSGRVTKPALPSVLRVARSTKHFGDLLERPPKSNEKLSEQSSIPCGPGKRDRVSSILVYKGFKLDRTERLFSLLRHLCPADDKRPIEADERHVWLGASPVGNVITYTETPTLHVWVDWLLSTGYRNGSMEKTESELKHILESTRVLTALVDAFEIPYSSLVSAISSHKYAKIIGGNEKTWLRFYMERSGHPEHQFFVDA